MQQSGAFRDEAYDRAYVHRFHSTDHWTAGTGRTGYLHVAPNNYPFYSDEETYIPIMQSDGGQLSGKLQPETGSKHSPTGLFACICTCKHQL